jgi:hypothetical protein
MAQPPVQTATPQPNSASLSLLELKLVNSPFVNVGVTTGAAAIIGATSLTVTALSGAIPAGATLHFANQDVILTAAAAAAATTLTVQPLTAALASGVTSTYDGFTVLPLLGGIALTLADTNAAYAAYALSGGDVWDYNVKTAEKFTLAFKTSANDNDPAVSPFVAAALLSGAGCQTFIRLRRASGSWYSGTVTLHVTPADPERGVAETMFTGTGTGKLTFTPV